MGFFLTLIGLHLDIQQKVFEEDQKIQQSLRGQPMTVEDLQRYEYTERAIKESMRLFPLGPVLARVSSEEVAFGNNNNNFVID